MKLRAASLLLLAAFAAISSAGEPDGPGLLKVDLVFKDQKVAAKAIRKAFGPNSLKGAQFQLRTKKGFATLERLRKLPGIKSATPIAPAPPLDAHGLNSVSRVHAAIEKYEADYYVYYRSTRNDKAKIVGEMPGCDYLESYLHFLQERTNPGKDSVDFAAYDLATKQRDQMPNGRIPTGNPIGPELVGNWQFVGPNNFNIPYRTYYGQAPLGGRFNYVAYDPSNTSTYYIAGAQSGVWKTTNQGVSWTCLSDNWARLLTSCVVVDPVNTNVVYVGTGDYNGGLGSGFGIRKSTSGGATWTTIGVSAFGSAIIKDIWIDPDDTDHLLAFTDRTQIKESFDGGASWSNATTNSYNISAFSAGVKDTSNVRALYATVRSSANTILRSLDNGDTWTALAGPSSGTNRADIAASKINPNVVYAMASNSRAIYKSTDRGATWTNTTNNFPMGLPPDNPNYNWSQSTYDMHMETSTNGTQDVIYVGLIDVAQSRDGGATWRSYGRAYFGDSNLHNDQHNMAVNPINPEEILIANDGGIYRGNLSNQTAHTIQSLNATLGGTTQFYHAAYHPTDTSRMIGGTQDNASPASLGNMASWANPGAGDGSYHFVSQSNPNNQVTTWQYMGAERTTNNWSSSSGITPSFPVGDSVAFIAPIEGDPTNGTHFYAGSEFLNRYSFSTSTWTYSMGGVALTTGTLRSMAVAPSDGQRIYTGGSDGQVWMTTNGGAGWTQITSGGLPSGNIKDIAVHPLDPNHLIVVQSSSSSTSRIWECKNPTAGAGRVWTARAGSGGTATPNIAHMSICLDPRAPSTDWYVATDVGVFMTVNGGSTWTNITNPLGLPNLRVDDLTFVPNTGSLYAATHGRGIWRVDVGSIQWLLALQGPLALYGANSATYTVQMASMAQSGGALVSLQSSNPGAVTVPASVTIPAGSNKATFTATAPWRSNNASSMITASRNGDTRSITIEVTGLVADINRDGIVDVADYGLLAAAFDSVPGAGNWNANADLNFDGIIDIGDYAILAAQFDLGG